MKISIKKAVELLTGCDQIVLLDENGDSTTASLVDLVKDGAAEGEDGERFALAAENWDTVFITDPEWDEDNSVLHVSGFTGVIAPYYTKAKAESPTPPNVSPLRALVETYIKKEKYASEQVRTWASSLEKEHDRLVWKGKFAALETIIKAIDSLGAPAADAEQKKLTVENIRAAEAEWRLRYKSQGFKYKSVTYKKAECEFFVGAMTSFKVLGYENWGWPGWVIRLMSGREIIEEDGPVADAEASYVKIPGTTAPGPIPPGDEETCT